MHLSAIKLAGFKSFVDTTNFDTNSQCVGVVGPNGCGKSNIMDAVRWVLGESRAGELRGETMQDVIFNGSTNRKPSYKASVELVFDNTSARLQGEWGRYNEVSVKRTLSRDGSSNYYINNQIVRRRDIHDMFMGTGLGPRAYAIIGQGMISRIIEARPEELRIFLEEAAGVSKYKERRKETQTRLQHATENLLRVQDLLTEIAQQLEKLEIQASTAKEYKKLHKSLLEYEYLYLNWCILHEKNKQQNMQANYSQIKANIEQINSQILHNEYEQNNLADNNKNFLQNLQLAQQEYNQINQQITQLEERTNYQTQQLKTLEQALKETDITLNEQNKQINYLQQQQEILYAQLEEIIIQQEIDRENNNNAQLEDLFLQEKTSLNQIQITKDKLNQLVQQIKLLEQKQHLLLQQIAQKYQRYQKLQQELQGFKKIQHQNIEMLTLDLNQQKQKLTEFNQNLAIVQNNLQKQQKIYSETSQKVQIESIEINRLQANLNALTSLSKIQNLNILNSINEILKSKSENNILIYLNNFFKINPHWEYALACLLQHKVNAFCLPHNTSDNLIQDLIQYLQHNQEEVQGICLSQLSNTYPVINLSASSIFNQIEILDVKIIGIMQQWLHNYHIAFSIEEALANRHTLALGHAFILPDGIIIDAFSIISSENSAQNALKNKRKIDDLSTQIKAQNLILEQAKSNMSESLNTYNNLQKTYQDLQKQIHITNQSIQEQQLNLDKLVQHKEFAQSKMHTHEQEMYELQQEMAYEREEHGEISFNIEEINIQKPQIEEDLLLIEQQYKQLKQKIDNHRNQQQQQQLKIQALTFKEQNLKQNLQRNINDIQLSNDNVNKAQLKINDYQSQIYELQPKITQELLQQALADKHIKYQNLINAQNTIGEYHQQVQNLQQLAKELQAKLIPLYEELHKLELNLQATTINYDQYKNQLNEIIFNLQKVADLPDTQYLNNLNSPNNLKHNIQTTKISIDNLGNVNLAAIEELEHTYTRYNALNEQLEDVTTAINTLQNAILKIDEETKALLQTTFDSVNHEFSLLFPQLFGGGQAKLNLVGTDMLNAGIQVMAQPPGKKNATIHLLSGGEKALTAIALIFAIFALNPAPFCLLDEVDAPLDDANTERYAKLIKKMSDKTQFLFISHNKIAMEIADQLIGVTMQEQGVSRIVSVDMVEAIKNLST